MLIAGYIREFEELVKWIVPDDVQKICCNFYQIETQIFGKGYNRYFQFGIDINGQNKFINSYKQWTKLPHLSSMCQSTAGFFKGYQNFASIYDQRLYVIGSNRENAIGMFCIKITHIRNIYIYIYIYI